MLVAIGRVLICIESLYQNHAAHFVLNSDFETYLKGSHCEWSIGRAASQQMKGPTGL